METPVVLDQAGRLGACGFPDSLANGIHRDVRVNVFKRGLKSSEQDDMSIIPAFTGRTFGADIRAEGCLPIQKFKPFEGGFC